MFRSFKIHIQGRAVIASGYGVFALLGIAWLAWSLVSLPFVLLVIALAGGIQLFLLKPVGEWQPKLPLREQVSGIRRTALYDADLGLYQAWYFGLRLTEESERCRRYGLSIAVLVVKVPVLLHPSVSEQGWRIQAAKAAYVTARSVRTVDLAASLGAMEFGLCLVHCDHAGAEAAARRLDQELSDYKCLIGIAIYPEDNCDAKALVALARGRAKRIHADGLQAA